MKWGKQGNDYSGKINWSWNLTIKNGNTNYLSEEGITYQKKEENKNSTIETKFDKFGDKVSMLETSNELDE